MCTKRRTAYHSLLKWLVDGTFRGVATKYLDKYLAYHNFIHYTKGDFLRKSGVLLERSLTCPIMETIEKISSRISIPTIPFNDDPVAE